MFNSLEQFNIIGFNYVFCSYSQFLLDNVSEVVFLNINLIHILLIGFSFLTISLKSVIEVCYMGFFYNWKRYAIHKKISFFFPLDEVIYYFNTPFFKNFFDLYIWAFYTHPLFLILFIFYFFCIFLPEGKKIQFIYRYKIPRSIFRLKNYFVLVSYFLIFLRFFWFIYLYVVLFLSIFILIFFFGL